ncbi:MAG TPA: ATP-binding cassette domain-containing protein, partial [Verrucomicrobiae bacterium]|nr:ATP-binding cassette domain-containing protein [Verrucomicrobiae bacterium]
MPPLIDLRGLTVEIPTPAGWIRPVDDVSFSLEKGESLGLVGESGSGKSMLALALMGLLPQGARVRGEAWLADPSFLGASANGVGGNGASSRANLLALSEREQTGVRGRDIAMIFQEPMTALNPVMRVGAQIAEA